MRSHDSSNTLNPAAAAAAAASTPQASANPATSTPDEWKVFAETLAAAVDNYLRAEKITMESNSTGARRARNFKERLNEIINEGRWDSSSSDAQNKILCLLAGVSSSSSKKLKSLLPRADGFTQQKIFLNERAQKEWVELLELPVRTETERSLYRLFVLMHDTFRLELIRAINTYLTSKGGLSGKHRAEKILADLQRSDNSPEKTAIAICALVLETSSTELSGAIFQLTHTYFPTAGDHAKTCFKTLQRAFRIPPTQLEYVAAGYDHNENKLPSMVSSLGDAADANSFRGKLKNAILRYQESGTGGEEGHARARVLLSTVMNTHSSLRDIMRVIYLLVAHTSSTKLRDRVLAALSFTKSGIKYLPQHDNIGLFKDFLTLTDHDAAYIFQESSTQTSAAAAASADSDNHYAQWMRTKEAERTRINTEPFKGNLNSALSRFLASGCGSPFERRIAHYVFNEILLRDPTHLFNVTHSKTAEDNNRGHDFQHAKEYLLVFLACLMLNTPDSDALKRITLDFLSAINVTEAMLKRFGMEYGVNDDDLRIVQFIALEKTLLIQLPGNNNYEPSSLSPGSWDLFKSNFLLAASQYRHRLEQRHLGGVLNATVNQTGLTRATNLITALGKISNTSTRESQQWLATLASAIAIHSTSDDLALEIMLCTGMGQGADTTYYYQTPDRRQTDFTLYHLQKACFISDFACKVVLAELESPEGVSFKLPADILRNILSEAFEAERGDASQILEVELSSIPSDNMDRLLLLTAAIILNPNAAFTPVKNALNNKLSGTPFEKSKLKTLCDLNRIQPIQITTYRDNLNKKVREYLATTLREGNNTTPGIELDRLPSSAAAASPQP
jgi:hypothetical protein